MRVMAGPDEIDGVAYYRWRIEWSGDDNSRHHAPMGWLTDAEALDAGLAFTGGDPLQKKAKPRASKPRALKRTKGKAKGTARRPTFAVGRVRCRALDGPKEVAGAKVYRWRLEWCPAGAKGKSLVEYIGWQVEKFAEQAAIAKAVEVEP
jgi:hypothetical protein